MEGFFVAIHPYSDKCFEEEVKVWEIGNKGIISEFLWRMLGLELKRFHDIKSCSASHLSELSPVKRRDYSNWEVLDY